MRLPIILALAVIVLTPSNIREIVQGAAAEAQVTIARFLEREPVQVAEADMPASRRATGTNAIDSIR